MVEHVKRLKRELVYKGAILDIYKDTIELPDGNKAEWDFVSHRMGGSGNPSGYERWENRDGTSVPQCAREGNT